MTTPNNKYTKIIKVLEGENNVFDFFSVIFGYRDIGIIFIYLDDDYVFDDNEIKENKEIVSINELIKKIDKNTNKKYVKKIKYIKDFIDKNYKNYDIVYGFNGLLFIHKKDKKVEEKIKSLMKNYSNPILSLDGGVDIGKLLNFPKCCIKQFGKEKVKSQKTTKLILDKKYINIPFAPCKNSCGDKWLKYYDEVMEKLKKE
ncbi:MAG: hypothetical protein PHS49_05835 [Candidatus Gracilibacteria bacterium]|nr:hypothetical protein [Candidatus Gracilibacteria bacterium]